MNETGVMKATAHSPEWWNECYFPASPDGALPEGLSSAQRPLFAHQEESVEKLRRWFDNSETKAGVLCLPTGGGKTRTAAHFILTEVLRQQKKALWLTHRKELLNQTIATFLESSLDAPRPYTVGRFAAGSLKVHSPVDVLVASIPTLAYRKNEKRHNLDRVLRSQGEFGLIVIDECHHGVARSWNRLIEELRSRCPDAKLLGLSATPTRSPSHERPRFWRIFGKIIHEVSLIELINQKILARPRVETVKTGFQYLASPDEKSRFERLHDLPRSLVNQIAADEGRNGRVVAVFQDRRDDWGQTLIFAATVEQGNFLTRKLKELGTVVEEVYADTPGPRRATIVEEFRKGNLDVVVNVGLFTEGTDLPGVQSVFIARPTRSPILFRQMVGRGLRGPKIGGSAECTVVAFYDEVTGLMADSLASSFRDEREAIVALGLAEADDDRTQGEYALEDDVDSPDDADELRRLEDELRELLREQLAEPTRGRECALIGWWQAVRGNRRAFLPVFDDVEFAIREFVKKEEGNLHEFAEEVELPYELLRRFFSLTRRAGVKPKYFDIEDATEEQLRGVLEQVAQGHGIPEEIAFGWLGGELGSNDAPLFAVKVDGRLVRIDEKAHSTLREEWNRYAAEFGVGESPELGEALATLLLAKSAKLGLVRDDAIAVLDAAADVGVFPDACRIATTATFEDFLTVLRYKPNEAWPSVLDKAWAAGLRDSFASKNGVLLAAIGDVVSGRQEESRH